MDKKNKIILGRKIFKFSATFFALLLMFSACKKEETNIGDDLNDSNLNLLTTDTITLRTYSDEILEMESDETSVNLLGAYTDPVFGGVNCGIVTQIVPEAFTQDFPNLADVVMDSVVLALRYTSINYYANLDEFSVEVFEIDDALVRTDQIYYTNEEPTFDEMSSLVLGGSQLIDPDIVKESIVGTDTLAPQVRIHLDPQVGLDLIADSQAGLMGENFATNTFKGLYIRVLPADATPGVEQGTILYFFLEDILSKMTLYYTAGGVSDRFDFDINSTCARYNKIDFDRTGTNVMAGLADQSVGEEIFYMQGGSIRPIVEFPYITDFNKNEAGEAEPRIINKAELVLPIQDFQPDVFDPATILFIARIIDDTKSTYTRDYASASIKTVAYDEANKEFRFTMTREIQSLLNGDSENVGYRIYSTAFFASTIERIVFNGSNTTLKEKPRLEITYTEY